MRLTLSRLAATPLLITLLATAASSSSVSIHHGIPSAKLSRGKSSNRSSKVSKERINLMSEVASSLGMPTVTPGIAFSPHALMHPVDYANSHNAAYVVPFVGTSSGPGGSINLFPGPSMPFGMVQLSPDTEYQGFGYHYYQKKIQGFSMTHMSGPGCSDEGDVFFTATTGKVHTQVKNMESPYSHSEEEATPGYYMVMLKKWGIKAELTATTRAGLARFTFPAGKQADVIVPISHTLNYTTAAKFHVVNNETVEGYVDDRCFCGVSAVYRVHYIMKFSKPFKSFGIFENGALTPNSRTMIQTHDNENNGGYVTWPASSHAQSITVKVGISYVDLAGAENNLNVEVGDKSFNTIRSEAAKTWNDELSVVDVNGGTPTQRGVFYTSLYHSLLTPSVYNDVDGRYLGFDEKVHKIAAGHLVYCNYSGWDIYRSQMPLVALLKPKRMEDMCQSIVLMYQQGGWIDRWPQINHYTNVMCGSPLTTVMCTAWMDGLHGFDMKTAYKGMLKDATQAPPSGEPYFGENNIDLINKLHYDPDDKEGYGSVSQIQEDCIAYASLAYVANALGKKQDAQMLLARAKYVRNVFDPEDHYFRPKNSDGAWREPFKISQNHGYVEGSADHYQWLDPEDMSWLVNAVGKSRFNQRLDSFFSYPTPQWSAEYYNPYNETDLETPFEYNFSGEPWRTQYVVRRVLRQNYPLTPDGVPGNDDLGEMSSWCAFSMMGIYSVDPASTAYELVSPLFRKITIHLEAPYKGKTFVIEGVKDAGDKPYIQSVKLNHKNLSQDWIWAREITNGGTIQFDLGKQPNKDWAVKSSQEPPSLTSYRK